MCGIAGILVSNACRFDVFAIAGNMKSRLTHRGPDDSGLVSLSNARGALAHTRLSILDLSSGGHQPMFTPDGRYCITYNGEIYNYRELRKVLDGYCVPTSIAVSGLLLVKRNGIPIPTLKLSYMHTRNGGSTPWQSCEECLPLRYGIIKKRNWLLRVIPSV